MNTTIKTPDPMATPYGFVFETFRMFDPKPLAEQSKRTNNKQQSSNNKKTKTV